MHNECGNLSSREIFSDRYVFSFLEHCAVKRNFRVRTDTFHGREATIDFLLKVLNIFGFRKEHGQKRVENRIHDVSHAVYGSYADIFVSNDRKLRHSVMAVYSFISIQTHILNREEFLAFSRTI